MGNYITIFEKLLDIIDWNTLKISTYKVDVDYNVYIPVLNELISNALGKLPVSEKLKKFGTIKLIDSSTISMGKTYFQWAEFRSTKAGIKLHTKFNLGKGVPELIVVSNAKSHDKTKMKELITKDNCIYIFDKGYVDYKVFDEFSSKGIRFITRLKDNSAITEVTNLEITYSETTLLDDSINIIEDIVCHLGTKDIQQRLGHSKLSTTMDTYSHVTHNLKEASINRFESIISSKK